MDSFVSPLPSSSASLNRITEFFIDYESISGSSNQVTCDYI